MSEQILTIPEIGADSAFSVLTYGASLTPDANQGTKRIITLTGGLTMNAPTNMKSGQVLIFKILNDGTGGYAITWNATYKWSGGTSPTMTTTASKYDIYTFIYDGTSLSGSFIQNF